MPWRDVNVVMDRLLLGNLRAARSARTMTDRQITHVLSVCRDDVPAQSPQSGLTHMRVPVEDSDLEDLLIYFQSTCGFIHSALTSGGTVLVHCGEGLSRSAAVIAAYLMWSRRTRNATEALDRVRRARDQIWVNPGFQEQLVLFELCDYQPATHPTYRNWRTQLDRRLRAAGLTRPGLGR
ncbi:phosphatases II [Fistulina hepatica ATCC 64428]|nr:phosphatases II [Fistulina hepatica ATCC 64428]